jgi:hypothetical protein
MMCFSAAVRDAPISSATRSSALLLAGLVLAGIVAGVSAQENHKSPNPAADSFSAEQEYFEHAVSLNHAAKAALASDQSIADLVKDEKLSAKDMPDGWFTAAEVHLFVPAERDLVVMGTGVGRGANTSTFWILRQTKEGYRVVFREGAHSLSLLSRRTNGFHDVETVVVSLSSHTILRYRFDGKAYRIAKSATHPNGEDP